MSSTLNFQGRCLFLVAVLLAAPLAVSAGELDGESTTGAAPAAVNPAPSNPSTTASINAILRVDRKTGAVSFVTTGEQANLSGDKGKAAAIALAKANASQFQNLAKTDANKGELGSETGTASYYYVNPPGPVGGPGYGAGYVNPPGPAGGPGYGGAYYGGGGYPYPYYPSYPYYGCPNYCYGPQCYYPYQYAMTSRYVYYYYSSSVTPFYPYGGVPTPYYGGY